MCVRVLACMAARVCVLVSVCVCVCVCVTSCPEYFNVESDNYGR